MLVLSSCLQVCLVSVLSTRRVPGIEHGSEDIHVTSDGKAFVSSGFLKSREMKEYAEKHKVKGRVFLFDFKKPSAGAVELGLKAGRGGQYSTLLYFTLLYFTLLYLSGGRVIGFTWCLVHSSQIVLDFFFYFFGCFLLFACECVNL